MGLLGHLLVRASPTVTDAAMSATRDTALDCGDADRDLSTASHYQMLSKLSDRISKSSFSSLDLLPSSPVFEAGLHGPQQQAHRMSFQRFGCTNDSNILESITEDPMSEGQEVILPDILGNDDSMQMMQIYSCGQTLHSIELQL